MPTAQTHNVDISLFSLTLGRRPLLRETLSMLKGSVLATYGVQVCVRVKMGDHLNLFRFRCPAQDWNLTEEILLALSLLMVITTSCFHANAPRSKLFSCFAWLLSFAGKKGIYCHMASFIVFSHWLFCFEIVSSLLVLMGIYRYWKYVGVGVFFHLLKLNMLFVIVYVPLLVLKEV